MFWNSAGVKGCLFHDVLRLLTVWESGPFVFILPRSGFVQLMNQTDNAAFGDSGLSCRFHAALRLI
jgi:hypothetical protein